MATYSAVTALQLGEAISSSGTDVLTADVSIYMVEGLQFLVNVIPTDMLWSMETADDFVDNDLPSSLDIDTNKILYVLRESDSNLIDTPGSEAGNDEKMLVECREIPASLRGRVTPGSGWKEEVSETDPVWYKLDGKVHILPTSTSTSSKLYWIKVPPSTWDSGAESRVYMSGTILFELEPLLLCYVVKRCLEQKLAKVELGTSSSLEAYIADEDLDLVQAQQVLIGDLLQRIALKNKNMQLMLGALMQGTIQPETADDTKRIPTYSGIAE